MSYSSQARTGAQPPSKTIQAAAQNCTTVYGHADGSAFSFFRLLRLSIQYCDTNYENKPGSAPLATQSKFAQHVQPSVDQWIGVASPGNSLGRPPTSLDTLMGSANGYVDHQPDYFRLVEDCVCAESPFVGLRYPGAFLSV